MPPTAPIATIRLARSLPRLLGLPAVGLVVGIGAVAAGLLLVAGTPGVLLAGAGVLVVALAVAAAVILTSIRLEVEEAAVRVHRIGGERRYALVKGPVTRVRLRGEQASSLRPAHRLLGWQLGAGRLRDEEDIEVVRLAPTATAILVPTDRGRLAIAAAREDELLDALARAAHARQRQDDEGREAAEAEARAPVAAQPPPAVERDPALMTGIERALYEARQVTPPADVEPDDAPAQEAVEEAPATTASTAAATPEILPARPRRRLAIGRPAPSAALVLLPLVGAGVAWGTGSLLDRLPAADSEMGRLTALALVLAGPVATVGAIMARVWWPRIVGVVVTGGLVAAVFVGRSLIGG